MTLVVLGIDALDPGLVDPERHPNLVLESHRPIETIVSNAGSPSTHELWPTIITGLEPSDHGLVLDDGLTWENPIIAAASDLAEYVLPGGVQTRLGAWLLNNTEQDAFRKPATYYQTNGLSTVFDGRDAKPIGIPNYVVDSDDEDREHQLRRGMGSLFERDTDAKSGHTSSDPETFYEQCLEMAMVRIARTRRALRSRHYELVFGYTSGLDLVGHVAYDSPGLQERAYDELDDFVGEVRSDLTDGDVLVLVSDHGLQDGIHTEEAMISSTDDRILQNVGSVCDVRTAIEEELHIRDHQSISHSYTQITDEEDEEVKDHLESLGYM